jgi:hypothetical protein
MFDKFDRKIIQTLRGLARQRVRVVLPPENYWVIDCAIKKDADTDAALATCFMRGWIEPLEHAVPSTQLAPDGSLPANFQFERKETIYRLTSAGWSAIHRSGTIAICALLISAMSFIVVVSNRLFH